MFLKIPATIFGSCLQDLKSSIALTNNLDPDTFLLLS